MRSKRIYGIANSVETRIRRSLNRGLTQLAAVVGASDLKQMAGDTHRVSHIQKVVLIFFAGGTVAAVLFAGVISRPSLKHVWFTTADWWLLPTPSYWLVVGGAFFAGFILSYVISILSGWLPLPRPWYRPILSILCAAVIAVTLSFLSTPGPSLAGIVLSPFVVGFFLSAAIFVLTWMWYKLATVLMVIVYLAAPIVADVPNLFVGDYWWFDAVTFFIRSSLLMALCGWWLARANSPIRELRRAGDL